MVRCRFDFRVLYVLCAAVLAVPGLLKKHGSSVLRMQVWRRYLRCALDAVAWRGTRRTFNARRATILRRANVIASTRLAIAVRCFRHFSRSGRLLRFLWC